MNITILANKDVASCLALNFLLQGLPDHRLSIFLSSRVGNKPLSPALQQLKFIEQDLFNSLLFPAQTSQQISEGKLLGFARLAAAVADRFAELNNINDADGLALFADSDPDLVLSVRYGIILKEAALTVPRHGVLNLHSGRLPDYKGVMATFWALLNGESEIGTSLHYIDDPSIDTGPIVSETSMQVDSQQSYLWHVLSLYQSGCQDMIEAVNSIAQGVPVATHRQAEGGQYFSFPTERELAEFASQGWQLWRPQEVMDLSQRFLASP